jgi:hypothetical protein
MNNYLGYEDDRLPGISKPELQQYDNYQIHDLYCSDILYQDLVLNTATILHPPHIKFKSFLAVEKISIHGEIPFDFEAIALMYP